MVPATVDLAILVEVDEIHQQLLTHAADKAMRVPAFSMSCSCSKDHNVPSVYLTTTLWERIGKGREGKGRREEERKGSKRRWKKNKGKGRSKVGVDEKAECGEREWEDGTWNNNFLFKIESFLLHICFIYLMEHQKEAQTGNTENII